MVERRKADREFWGCCDMNDELPLLAEPLAAADDSVRGEVPRLSP